VSDDKLDMTPSTDPDHPMGGKISIPRMITAQFDHLEKTKILSEFAPQAMKRLHRKLSEQKYPGWFTIYLSLFLLLHQLAVISGDRRRWAIANSGAYGLVR
jgi:hypothetical protein